MQLLKRTGYTDKVRNTIATSIGSFGHNIYKMCTVVPAVVYTLILILTIIYPLSKKRLEPIQAELMKRRAEVDEKLKELESL